jgi:DNA-binding response OmpR family regulator
VFVIVAASTCRGKGDPMGAHILVVEDDPFMAKMLAFLLADAGYHASSLPDPRAVLPFLREHPVALVLLDTTLPHIDGLALCASLRRAYPDTPIIILSARGRAADKVAGLERGADDYLAKPFEPTELLARVQAVLRRSHRTERHRFGMTIRVGETVLDLGQMQFTRAQGAPVQLTATEMRLLECLMRNANVVVPRERLIERVWGYDAGGEGRVSVYMRRLREKIEADPAAPAYVLTVRGLGYVFRARHDGRVNAGKLLPGECGSIGVVA